MDARSIMSRLEKLDVSQIMSLRDEYQRTHPRESSCAYLCNLAISKKLETEEKVDFIRMLEFVEQQSAPDSAATPSQGNETR